MATINGHEQDALLLLRSSIAANSPPIATTNPDATTASDVSDSLAEATHLIFNTDASSAGTDGQHFSISLTQPTRFIRPEEDRPIDLRSIYFSWLKKDEPLQDYINACGALSAELAQAGKQETVTNLKFSERVDIINWLSGEIGEEGESEFIQSLDANRRTKDAANDAAATAAGGEDVEMRDAGLSDAAARKREEDRLREIYALERKMGDRNTVLHGVKVQDFSNLRKFTPMFLSKARPAQGGAQPNLPGPTGNPALRPAIKPSGQRRQEPIILLSPSASSIIRMLNVKSFLQEGVYNAPEAGGVAPNILHLTRTLPSIDSKPMRFILVDSHEQFRPDYWNRVVAVFTTGQAWQFKGYKWQQPADLWTHVLGVYVGWKGEMVPDTVKGWGRGVLKVALDKSGNARWRDREVVEEVWGGIESTMRTMGWTKDGPRA